MHMAGTSLGFSGISSKNYRSYFASPPALFKAINFDSIVERVMQVCLEDFHDTIVPPRATDFDTSESAI